MTISDELIHTTVRLAGDSIPKVNAIFDAEPPPAHPTLADAAAAYAANGIPVFPLRPGEKRPATRNGFKDATTDPGQVHAWWTENPQYNIGFPTGHLFDVIDIDGPPGYLSLLQLRDAGAIPDLLGKAHTSRAGQHLYIPPTGDGNAAGVLDGVDYRGAGGYVVAPPSLSTTTGRRWTWIREPAL